MKNKKENLFKKEMDLGSSGLAIFSRSPSGCKAFYHHLMVLLESGILRIHAVEYHCLICVKASADQGGARQMPKQAALDARAPPQSMSLVYLRQ